MLNANFHTHTFRCNHATETEREYVERAIKSGLKVLGFSDHSPYYFRDGYYSSFRMKREEFAGYVKTVRELQNEYSNRIKILLGVELEYYPNYFNQTLEFLKPFNLDYYILGQHHINNEYDGCYCGKISRDRLEFSHFISQEIEGLKTGLFSYVAHPDLMDFVDDKVYAEEVERLLRFCAEKDIPIEFNFLGFTTNRIYPNERFFELAGKYNVKVIYGIDAHSKNAIAICQQTADSADKIINKYGLQRVESIKLLNGEIV